MSARRRLNYAKRADSVRWLHGKHTKQLLTRFPTRFPSESVDLGAGERGRGGVKTLFFVRKRGSNKWEQHQIGARGECELNSANFVTIIDCSVKQKKKKEEKKKKEKKKQLAGRYLRCFASW